MLSIGRLAGPRWSAEYYLARQAGCPADYYVGSGERRGVWVGRGAAALGLSGEIDETAFRHLLSGRSPDGHSRWVEPVLRVDPRGKLAARPLFEALRAVAAAKATTAEAMLGDPRLIEAYGRLSRPGAVLRADVATDLCRATGIDPAAVFGPTYDQALPYVDQRVDARIPGLDLTFSAPKSVSVLFGLAPVEAAAQVRAGHEEAVRQALEYLDRVAGHGLRGHQGDHRRARRVPTDGFVAAAFQHRSNRCGDMQLHHHVVVVNMLTGEDGEVSALDSRELFQQARTAGFLYQAALRHELTARLGVDWTPVTRGYAEIVGIPEGVRTAFSKRRQQIERTMAERGRSDPKAAQEATMLTRPAKPSAPGDVPLRERWADEARGLGYDPSRVLTVLDRARQDTEAGSLMEAQLLTHDQSTFDRRDVLRAVAESLPHGAPVDKIEELADEVIATPDVVPLIPAADRRRYSTAALLAVEERGLALASGRRVAALDGRSVGATLARYPGLYASQLQMVRRVLTSDKGVDVVMGCAGSGKTSALRAACDAWAGHSTAIVGTAVAASAAHHLQVDLGVPATSLTRLLGDAGGVDPRTGQPAGLVRGSVVILDEAAMVGTRQFVHLLEHVAAAEAKLVCVGDPRQLPAVEAGGMFAALARRLGAIELGDNVRQQQPWERDALNQIRDGDVPTAIQSYLDHDRVHTADNADDLRQRMVDSWWTARTSGGGDVAMLAVRRADVSALNLAARQRMRNAGQLSGNELTVEGPRLDRRAFAVGDEVVVTRNAYPLGLLNGSRGRVTAVDPARGTVAMTDTLGLPRCLDAAMISDGLDYGYATTCHKAQGLTADVALLYGTKALTRESGYVALSRGRQENHIFAVAEELDRTLQGGPVMDEIDDRPQQRDNDGPEAATRALSDALESSHVDALAIESVDPEGLAGRLAAVRARQQSAVPNRPPALLRWSRDGDNHERDTDRAIGMY